MSTSHFELRRAVAADVPLLRQVRLEALKDAPAAFGSTYERESARTDADWLRWLSPGVTFLLVGSHGPTGLVGSSRDSDEPDVAHLMAMWVHPSIRGSGAADVLVEAVLAWAKTEGAHAVRLEVMQDNARARALYERHGFQCIGEEADPDRPGRIRIRMERSLNAGPAQ